ncbi:MAG: helix-turn-helix domain-containing protein [Bacteroidales bacterium]|nr:helix-turn-helix domain-containing protein [Bacteroidales bacterium]
MRNILFYIMILCALIGCGETEQPARSSAQLGNTPYQQDTIMVEYAVHPERALVLLDSAALLGNIDPFHEQLYRAVIYSKSLVAQNQDSAQSICETLLQHDSVKARIENREAVIDVLLAICRSKADDNEYLRWATEKAEVCRALDEEVELLRAEAEVGVVMTHIGRTEEGLEKINHSIQELDQPGSLDRMDAFIVASKRKIHVLGDLERYAEIIPVAQHILDRLTHYEKHADAYVEDSYRLLWSEIPEDCERYIDFYRAQANGFLANAYAMMGERARALEYLTRFEQSNYAKTWSARRMIEPTQMALGLYDEAMQTDDRIVEGMQEDTMNMNYAIILRNRAVVAYASGRTDEAYHLMNRHALLSKALSDSLHRSEAHEYAARYHDQEQDMKIREMESENRQKTIVVVLIALLLLVTLTAVVYFWHQKRLIARKNHALVRMISEAHLLPMADSVAEDRLDGDLSEDLLEEGAGEQLAGRAGEQLVGRAGERLNGGAGEQLVGRVGEQLADAVPHSAADLQREQRQTAAAPVDAQLFNSIDSIIRRERLYANPNLQRQDICDRFGINRITLNNMLLQCRKNASLPQYINALRMEEAIKFLREQPDLSITAIAERVGFSPANFRRQFTRHFGMTPMEFRLNL